MSLAPAPVTEMGYGSQPTGSAAWWTSMDTEHVPELRWPLSVHVFDRMRKSDAQVISALLAVKLPIERTAWRLDPNGSRPEVYEPLADDLNLPVVGAEPKPSRRTRDRFSWAEHLRLALLKLDFGHSVFEQQYRIDENGLARIRKIAPRLQRTISGWNVGRDGGLESVYQYGVEVPIPITQLVVYTHNREGGSWWGQSILRPAWKAWYLKDPTLKTWVQTIDRNGMGVPIYEAAEDETDLAAGLAIAQGIRSGANSGAATPHGAKLRMAGVEGNLPDAEPAVRYFDEQIARAVLAHFLNLGTQTGSWALGSTFADFFVSSLQATAMQIADTATQHIVEDWVDLNFGPDEPAPRIVFDEIGTQQQATAQALKLLVDAGLIFPDKVLEEALRQQYSLPAKPAAGAAPAGPSARLEDRPDPRVDRLTDAVLALATAPPPAQSELHLHVPAAETTIHNHVEQPPAPVVHVAASETHVDVHTPEPVVHLQANPPRTVIRTVERDSNGDMVRIVDEEQ